MSELECTVVYAMRMISVIIPAYNEEARIKDFLKTVQSRTLGNHEYIVAAGGTDNTANEAHKAGAIVVAGGPRPFALNSGAKVATGKILYFLHADTVPPKHWDQLILKAIERGAQAGSFRLKFDNNHSLLSFFAWFTRFSWSLARFGDQSLFVTKVIYQKANGFNEKMLVMEDSNIVRRLKKVTSFAVIPEQVITSARKYEKHGFYRLQCIYILVTFLYYCRVPQNMIMRIYRGLLSN